MKNTTGFLCTALAALALSNASLHADPATHAPGQVDFGTFAPSEDGQFVEVNIQSNLISMVARLTEDAEPELAKILRGLKAIRVNVIGLNDANIEEMRARVHSIRQQLTADGWERIVTVQDGSEDVGVYTRLKGDEAVEGIAVTVLSGDSEAVFVNIVGDIRPEQIARVGERLNIAPLKHLSENLGTE